MTWFPTMVFMDFMLPLYGWEPITSTSYPFPKLAAWYERCRKFEPFERTRGEIWDYWVQMKGGGQFQPILEEIEEAEREGKGLKYRYP